MEISVKDVAEVVTVLAAMGGIVWHLSAQISKLGADNRVLAADLTGQIQRVSDSLGALRGIAQGQDKRLVAVETRVQDLRERSTKLSTEVAGLREAM